MTNEELELILSLGLDPETIDGDFAEYSQRWNKVYEDAEIDRRPEK